MNEPLVSVIIPFYNRVDVTLKALQSAIDQTYKNTEIILINDGSTDDISSIVSFIESKDNCKLITTENAGPASARNTGIRYSKGEYIAFLDSDDLWLLNKLEIQIKMMMENGWEFSHTSYNLINSLTGDSILVNSGKKNYKYPWIAFRCRIATPTVVLKRNLIRDIAFIENIRVGEDTIFWLHVSLTNTLHGINTATVNVYTNPYTTAKNPTLKSKAYLNINKYGLKNSKIISYLHYFYYSIRQLCFFLKI